MASKEEGENVDYSKPAADGSIRVKVICLGDSAVGKSKLIERYILKDYLTQQLSTYALTMYQHKTKVNDQTIHVDVWDTAGQERFHSIHPTYYHQAHACILVFDVSRKMTYKALLHWVKEVKEFRPEIPCLCAANKIDVYPEVTQKTFSLPKAFNMPLYFVSASDGTNVVELFDEAIKKAVEYKKNPTDFNDEIFEELEALNLSDEADEVDEADDVDETDEADEVDKPDEVDETDEGWDQETVLLC